MVYSTPRSCQSDVPALGAAKRLGFQRHLLVQPEGIMSIKIRPATTEDRQALWQVHTEAIRQTARSHYDAAQIEAWAGHLTPEGYHPDPDCFFVAETEGSVVGFGELNLKAGEIEAVFVAQDYGRRGIGRQILQALEEVAAQRGLTHLVLDASLNAVAFYKVMGYRQKEPTVQVYGKDAVELPGMLMTKLLPLEVTGDANGDYS